MKLKKYIQSFLTLKNKSLFKEANDKIKEHLNIFYPLKDFKSKEDLYFLRTDLSDHISYFVFHINPDTHMIKAISYIDGNTILDSRKIKDDDDLIYGVTKFNLSKSVFYIDSEELIKIFEDFLKNTTYSRDCCSFYNYLISGNVKFGEQKLIECQQSNSLPVSAQKRNNCALKSNKILQRYLISKHHPKISFEIPTPEGTKDGRELFKEYKTALKYHAIVEIEKICSKLTIDNPFNSFLLKQKKILREQIDRKDQEKLSRSLKRATVLAPSTSAPSSSAPSTQRFEPLSRPRESQNTYQGYI